MLLHKQHKKKLIQKYSSYNYTRFCKFTYNKSKIFSGKIVLKSKIERKTRFLMAFIFKAVKDNTHKLDMNSIMLLIFYR